MSSTPDVRLVGVTKRFEDVVAVDDLSLEIETGSFYGIALAGYVQFRAEGHIPVVLAPNDSGQVANLLHHNLLFLDSAYRQECW